MFGIGWSELIFAGVVALLVLGPDKLPVAARQVGRWMRELRATSADLRAEFRAELDDDSDAIRPASGSSLFENDVDDDHTTRSPEAGFGQARPRMTEKNEA